MATRRSRRSILRTCGLITALGVAGCLGDSASDPATNGTTDAISSPSTQPDPDVAGERALAAERNYVESRLQNATCLESWGIGEYTMEATATVTEQTADGLRIEVQRPYSYSKADQIADVATHAEYLVARNQTERLSGETVDPC